MNTAVRSSWSWSVTRWPEIIAAGRYPVLEKSLGVLHAPTPYVTLYCHDYRGTLRLGDERFELQPGDLTLVPACADAFYDVLSNGFHLCVQFHDYAHRSRDVAHALSLPLHMRPGLAAPVHARRMAAIVDLVRRAEHLAPRRRTLALAAASAGLQELLLTLALSETIAREDERLSPKVEVAVQTLVGLIENRLHQTLSVPDLANEAQLSQNYLARAFRSRYGLTVPNYLLRRRIERARHLLTTTRLSIKQVASEVGLADIQHFNKQFRRLTGVSPSAYRERR